MAIRKPTKETPDESTKETPDESTETPDESTVESASTSTPKGKIKPLEGLYCPNCDNKVRTGLFGEKICPIELEGCPWLSGK